ncbi:MAG TPA: AAA family ATPase [Thermodesulfobacteriota bacterium]|nr:AAA family ATPase [Thermodesulfobacteriota bacterium]
MPAKMGKDIDIKEIQKDLSDYLTKKYGRKIQFAGFGPIPEPAGEKVEEGEKEKQPGLSAIHFDMKPEELKAYLDGYLVKQDDAKEVLATKVCTHFNRIKMFEMSRKYKQQESVGEIKNNIIMIGPTGVGKTFLVKLIARKIGVPFVKGDATKFSETGYVGGDVEDLVRDLVYEAKGNVELAQYGIIYLDEVDKIAASPNLVGPDVSRSGVQRALLKPMEETEVELKVPHDPVSQMEALMEFQKTGKREKKKINTKNILFIMSGAFNGLDEMVKKRLNRQGIGFGAEIRSKDEKMEYLKKVKAEDLIEYGFESEFIGRLPVVTVFEHLEVDDLYKILRNPKSPIILGKKRDFKAYNIHLQFEDESLQRIAENAFQERTGARGLVSAVERVLLKFEHTLPSTNIRHLVVTRAMVDDPAGELKKILDHADDPGQEAAFQELLAEEEKNLEALLREKAEEWQERYGIRFSDERIQLITRRSVETQTDVDGVVEEIQAIHQAAREFAEKFSLRNDLGVSFTEEAINRLVEKVWKEGLDPGDYLGKSFQNYEHGLKLIREKTGKREFSISAEGMENPEQFLNGLIQETYRSE